MPGAPEPAKSPPGSEGGGEGSPGIREIARHLTEPEPCPYLHDRPSRMELRVVAAMDPSAHLHLLRSGFRRFGMVVFRPVCEGCAACVPLRVDVRRFRPSPSQRRVARRNRDVRVEIGPPQVDPERIELHRAFHRERSVRVGWAPQEITEEEYSRTFLDNTVRTLELCYRVGGLLAAVAYVDVGPEALNSIYCFHHPELHRRSLGTFDVLMEISLARRLGIPHLYLGYHIAACRSMAYKAAFRPAEVRVGGAWRDLEG